MLNILIGCECSGAIRQRFRDAGFNAWSCDLKPAEDGSAYHIIDDVFLALKQPYRWCAKGARKWDLFICHPECTALTVAGNHAYACGKPKHHERIAAIKFTNSLWDTALRFADRVAFENPQGVLSTQSKLGKASQYIQPYQFGDDASKKTGLWLHNLPKLKETNRIKGRMVEWPKGSGKLVERFSNQTDSGQNKLGPSPARSADRARTYPGIANAVVEQWGMVSIEEAQ